MYYCQAQGIIILYIQLIRVSQWMVLADYNSKVTKNTNNRFVIKKIIYLARKASKNIPPLMMNNMNTVKEAGCGRNSAFVYK